MDGGLSMQEFGHWKFLHVGVGKLPDEEQLPPPNFVNFFNSKIVITKRGYTIYTDHLP